MTDEQALRALEENLWRDETRFDRSYVERVFHPDFFEFGRSGRSWTRAESIAAEGGPIGVELPLPAYRVEEIASGVALAHYISRKLDGSGAANRTSVWLHTDDGWRLRFHQGTPIPDRPGAAPT